MRPVVRTVLVLFIGVILGIAVSSVRAQSKVSTIPPSSTTPVVQGDAQMMSGGDVAIRIDGRRNGKVVGTLMTRVDGAWTEVQLATQSGIAVP